jgi:hypothetical protein
MTTVHISAMLVIAVLGVPNAAVEKKTAYIQLDGGEYRLLVIKNARKNKKGGGPHPNVGAREFVPDRDDRTTHTVV